MATVDLHKELSENTYPGRGIVIGRSENGRYAVAAYFIMGRSDNSRNRVFVTEKEGIRTEAFDPARLEDPSLIIYAPVRMTGDGRMIVTNGDQTDTILAGLEEGLTFEESLRGREFEPDGPNYTPRISGLLTVEGGEFSYTMSILKSDQGDPSSCHRFTFDYRPVPAGRGHFISTYLHDGDPLPSFEGEPRPVEIPDDMEDFTQMLWTSLNEENKISLFVRYMDIGTRECRTRIINKNQ